MNPEQSPLLTGRPVVDAHLEKVGRVTDVLDDGPATTARWVVVKTGVLKGERYAPLDDTYIDENGRLVVPVTKTTIKHAPRPGRDHVLTIDQRRDLRDYYRTAAA